MHETRCGFVLFLGNISAYSNTQQSTQAALPLKQTRLLYQLTISATMPADALNPTGPAQPDLDDVYKTEGNAASKEPAEVKEAHSNATDASAPT